jgi:hypothetical protein
MKWLVYLLILLLISAQVDDAWAVAPDFSDASLADENDEYLLGQRQIREKQSSSGQEPMFVGLTHTADFSSVRTGVPSERNLTTPFTPPPLYVLMSLQI